MVAPDLPTPDDLQRARPEYWTKARLELVGWLKKNAPPLADVYKGAVEITYGHRVPGWTRFVCHAMREIGNRLPDFFVGSTARTKKDADHYMSDLVQEWTEQGYPTDGTLPGVAFSQGADLPTDAAIPVSHRVLRIASAMVRDYVVGCDTRRDATAVLFQALTPIEEGDRAKLRLLANEWHQIKRWADGRAHVSSHRPNEADPDECLAQFTVFETILGSLVWDFFTAAGEIDEILEYANA